jgi:hypothetical protein
MRITLIVAFLLAAFGPLFAQDQPPQAPQPVNKYGSPYQAIENAASDMNPRDADSLRAVAEAIFNFPLTYRMPDVMAAVVKQRLIDAQKAYLDGKTPGIVDGAVVDAINALATAFEAPDYGRTSLLQVQFFRSSLAAGMPIFLHSAPDTKADEPNPPMSPLQAIFVMGLLIDQKLTNPDYQVAPAEWDSDSYPRLLAQFQQRRELQRRIEAGEVKVQTNGELRSRVVMGPPYDQALLTLVRKGVLAMSVADGLKLFNETFARLGIQ